METPDSSAKSSVAETKFEVGATMRLTTCLNEELEGQVLAFDADSNFLVIHILYALPMRPNFPVYRMIGYHVSAGGLKSEVIVSSPPCGVDLLAF